MRIVVAGGGIAGLSAALCLSHSGHDIEVLEQADQFSEIGAGLQCGANVLRIMEHLGLREALERVSVAPSHVAFRSFQSGRVLYRSTLGEKYQQRWQVPYLNVHRADLLGVLLDACKKQANIRLQTGMRVRAFEEYASKVVLDVEDTAIKVMSKMEADCLLACDGVRSVIRRQLFLRLGQEAQARFTGNVAWRATIDTSKLPDQFMDTCVNNFMGERKHVVMYYLRSKQLLNFVGVAENKYWLHESWEAKAPWEELQRDYQGWHPMVQQVIENIDKDACFRWALYDHPVQDQWVSKRVALLGDAAHAALPFMASGAAMAIEDARILQRCFDAESDLAEALQCFQRNRVARCKRVQRDAKRLGRMYHIPNTAALHLAFLGFHLVAPFNESFLPSYNANTIELA